MTLSIGPRTGARVIAVPRRGPHGGAVRPRRRGPASRPGSSAGSMATRTTRVPRVASTVSRQPSASTESPVRGRRPSRVKTSPPTLVTVSSTSSTPWSAQVLQRARGRARSGGRRAAGPPRGRGRARRRSRRRSPRSRPRRSRRRRSRRTRRAPRPGRPAAPGAGAAGRPPAGSRARTAPRPASSRTGVSSPFSSRPRASWLRWTIPSTPSPLSTGKRLCRVRSASVRRGRAPATSASRVVTSGRGVMMSRVRLSLEAEDALQHVGLLGLDGAALLALGDQDLEVLRRGGELAARSPAPRRGRAPAALPAPFITVDEGREQHAEPLQRAGDRHERVGLGLLDRDRLRRQLADHDVQHGDDDEGEDHAGQRGAALAEADRLEDRLAAAGRTPARPASRVPGWRA